MARILHVTNDAGSFLGHRLPLALAARTAGHEVHVAAPGHPDLAKLAGHGLAIHAIPLRRGSLNPLKELGTLRALRRLYHEVRPDLVHHVTLKPNVYGGVAARAARIPASVTTFAGLGFAFSSDSLKAKVLRLGLVPAIRTALSHPNSAAIFENEGNLRRFVEARLVAEPRARLIKSVGVPLDEFPILPFPGPTEAGPVVSLPARMLWSKGVGEFVAAAKRLRADGVRARFVLIGPLDPENPEAIAEEQLKAWQAAGDVEWWGRLPALDIFRRSDVVCLPSHGEGVPRVLLEAASCGRPVIASDDTGCREACQDGVTGFVVPVRDEAALAQAMRALVQDPGLARRMGTAGRRFIEADFDQQAVVAKTLALYDELLAGQASRNSSVAPMAME